MDARVPSSLRIGGGTKHWLASGPNAIYSPTNSGFRIYVRDVSAIDPTEANRRNWVINWEATPASVENANTCSGSTSSTATDWRQYDSSGLYVDVDTSVCGFDWTPQIQTSLGGNSKHWTTTNGTSVCSPSPSGFRIYLRDVGAVTPEIARSRGWHLDWVVGR